MNRLSWGSFDEEDWMSYFWMSENSLDFILKKLLSVLPPEEVRQIRSIITCTVHPNEFYLTCITCPDSDWTWTRCGWVLESNQMICSALSVSCQTYWNYQFVVSFVFNQEDINEAINNRPTDLKSKSLGWNQMKDASGCHLQMNTRCWQPNYAIKWSGCTIAPCFLLIWNRI